MTFTGSVNGDSARGEKFVIGPASWTSTDKSVFPVLVAVAHSLATVGSVLEHSRTSRPPGITSGSASNCAPSCGGTTWKTWLPLASRSEYVPNCTVTGCVICTGRPLIVNVPEAVMDLMHPIANPGAACRMIGSCSGQSVNGA